MTMMADILQTDERVNDVIAYINTLPRPTEQLSLAAREND